MRGRTLNQDFFKHWNRDMAYVLGFFAADGNMIRNKRGGCYVAFYSSDFGVLQAIKKVLGSQNAIGQKPARNPRWKPQYHIQFGSKQLYTDLLALGFTPNKSKTLVFPQVPEAYRRGFSGVILMATDVYISKGYNLPIVKIHDG